MVLLWDSDSHARRQESLSQAESLQNNWLPFGTPSNFIISRHQTTTVLLLIAQQSSNDSDHFGIFNKDQANSMFDDWRGLRTFDRCRPTDAPLSSTLRGRTTGLT